MGKSQDAKKKTDSTSGVLSREMIDELKKDPRIL